MSTVAVLAMSWLVLCCLGLLAMSVLGHASARADRDSDAWAREAALQRGLRLLPGERTDTDATCPSCAVVVRGAAAGTACPACGRQLAELPRIAPAAQRRHAG